MTEHLTDATTTKGHTARKPLSPEQIAAMSSADKEELIAELTAAIADLQRPAIQPYPKWVNIGGVDQIVDSPEDEHHKMAAQAGFEKEQKRRPGAQPEHPIEEPPAAEPRRR
jgi:hypothetical protein